MKKKLIVIGLLAASIMYVGIKITQSGFSSRTTARRVQTTIENVCVEIYNVLSEGPFPSTAQHEAKYEREFHYTVKEIPTGNIQETPVKDIEEVKTPLPLQEYLDPEYPELISK